jgi:D-alanyl-D-alanine carboxypeptidase (penicillin-binding protein 5/6)
MWLRRWSAILIGGLVFFLLGSAISEALAAPTRSPKKASQKANRKKIQVKGANVQPLPNYEAVLLADAETGQVLFSRNADKQWPAASLTKMMVGLLVLEEIQRGRLSFQTPVKISKRANLAGGRTINLRPGQVYPLAELLQAMLVTSANDASVAVAERLAGSVEACVRMMNGRARELGMIQTMYRTVNGMPPVGGSSPDMSSAVDQVILARQLMRYPEVLRWTSQHRMPFRDGEITLPNTNHLVGKVTGVDGLKTGFTLRARFNLVTTARRGQLRLIAVVMGGRNSQIRFQTAADLLEWGFAQFTRLRLLKSGEPVGADIRVEHGSVSTIQPIAATDAAFLMKKNDIGDVQIFLQVPAVVSAPIARHQVLGEVVVRNNTRVLAVIPALSPREIPRARWFPARR